MFRTLILILLPLITLPVWATLGEGPDSIEKDRAALGGAIAPAASSSSLPSSVRIYQMQVGGTIIKEFADVNGQIFAISFRGLSYPRLEPLLGRFHAEFLKKDKSMPKGRRYPRQPVKSEHVTLTRSGHVPDLRGIVILNGQLPDGVKEEDLL